VREHAADLAGEQVCGGVELRLVGRDDAALLLQLAPERRLRERAPVLEPGPAKDAEDALWSADDATLVIAERAGLGAQRSRSGSSLRIRSSRRILCQ
jgi:hypothetical protein